MRSVLEGVAAERERIAAERAALDEADRRLDQIEDLARGPERTSESAERYLPPDRSASPDDPESIPENPPPAEPSPTPTSAEDLPLDDETGPEPWSEDHETAEEAAEDGDDDAEEALAKGAEPQEPAPPSEPSARERFEARDGGHPIREQMDEKVLAFLVEHPGATVPTILEGTRLHRSTVKASLRRLRSDLRVEYLSGGGYCARSSAPPPPSRAELWAERYPDLDPKVDEVVYDYVEEHPGETKRSISCSLPAPLAVSEVRGSLARLVDAGLLQREGKTNGVRFWTTEERDRIEAAKNAVGSRTGPGGAPTQRIRRKIHGALTNFSSMTDEELAHAIDEDREDVSLLVGEMRDDGAVEMDGDGRYRACQGEARV